MGKWVHRLSEVNPDEGTAICAHCGPVGIKRKHNGWRCRVAESRWDWANHRKQVAKRDSLQREQNGLCAICNSELTKPHLDHCHSTGAIRGVLCSGCNIGLGHFNEDPQRLRAAIKYLDDSR